MDPVTTAIVAAIAAGVSKVGEKTVIDSYKALKALLKEKIGKNSEVVKAIGNLESKPESEGRKATLQEEISNAKADKDAEILKTAQEILKLLESEPGGGEFIQQATGSYIAQAGPGGSASVRVNRPKKG